MQTIQRDSVISFPFLHLTLNPPASFTVFGKEIYFYGVIIAFAFLLGVLWCSRNCKRFGIREDDVYDAFIWLLPFSIIGARLYFVLFQWDYYLAHPAEIIAVWEGGLAIYGGVIAGALVLLFVSRKKKIPFGAMVDLFIVACVLGQAIGRWGNFMNREAFGAETDVFCKMGLTNPLGTTIYVHPTFLYESLWNFALYIFFNVLLRCGKRKYDGQFIYIYCLWYGLGRAWIEGLRTDSLYVGHTGIRVSQVLSAVLVLFGALMLILNRKKNNSSKEESVDG